MSFRSVLCTHNLLWGLCLCVAFGFFDWFLVAFLPRSQANLSNVDSVIISQSPIPRWPLPRSIFDRRAFLISYGYPFGSISALYLGPRGAKPAVSIGIRAGLKPINVPWQETLHIPILPSPFIFLDLSCWIGIAYLFQAAKRRRRRSQGKCEACGFGPWSLGNTCPECACNRTSTS
jgi:hypothetical protein